jgi:hypothetical protein
MNIPTPAQIALRDACLARSGGPKDAALEKLAQGVIAAIDGNYLWEFVAAEVLAHRRKVAHPFSDVKSDCFYQDGYQAGMKDGAAERDKEHQRKRFARDSAEKWLADILQAGPIFTSDMETKARSAGHSERTIRRARAELGVIPKRVNGRLKIELRS